MGPPHRLPWAPAAGRRTASLARGLKALAHPVRLEMLAILSRAGQSLCELEANLPVKQPTVSRHLRAAGLLGREQRGVWAYYSVRPDRLAELWKSGLKGPGWEPPAVGRPALPTTCPPPRLPGPGGVSSEAVVSFRGYRGPPGP